jgi:hypothetical protein
MRAGVWRCKRGGHTIKVSAIGVHVSTQLWGNSPALIWSLVDEDDEDELELGADEVGVAGSVWIEKVCPALDSD